MFRVAIRLPRFTGLGSYGNTTGSHGAAKVVATGGLGLHGWTTFTDNHGGVTVTDVRAGTITGRFNAVFSGHRRFFHAYGAWRCTTVR